HRIERAFLIVLLVPRSEIFPAEPHLERELWRYLPVVVDERRKGRRFVKRARAAERARARRAISQQEDGHRVTAELAVEREAAARRHLGELFVPPVLGLQSEPHIVTAPHPARRVRHTEDILGRALRDAA